MTNRFPSCRQACLKILIFIAISMGTESGYAAVEDTAYCVAQQSVSWTEQESWVWERICNRERADLRDYLGLPKDLYPWEQPEELWTENRIITAGFLYDILTREPYKSTIENLPVRILGAWLVEPFLLEGVVITNLVALDDFRFDERVELRAGVNVSRLSLGRSWFRRNLTAFGMVMETLLMTETRLDDELVLQSTKANSVILGDSLINGMANLTGLEADSLVLGIEGRPTSWGPNAVLTLKGAAVEALVEQEASWQGLQDKLDLEGFLYTRFATDASLGLGVESGAQRSLESLLGWLEMQARRKQLYIPQPYEQLATVLYNAGQPDKADQVLYAQNEYRRTHRTTPFGDKVWLTIKKFVIGYGYQIWLTIAWLLALIGVGAAVLRFSRQGGDKNAVQCVLYSLDQAIPLVNLQPRHEDIAREHGTGLQAYYLAHQILSLIFISFLGAGLAGAIG